MNNQFYCDYCNDYTKTEVRVSTKTFTHKEKSIEVTFTERYCTTCHHSVYDEQLDQKMSEQFIKTYNASFGLRGDAIKSFRKSLKLRQEDLSNLLGISKKTIVSYEKEQAIPEKSNENLLRLVIEDPKQVYSLSEMNHVHLPDKAQKALSQVLEKESRKCLNDMNGYKRFDVDRLKTLILYLSSKTKMCLTKLNKALFYLDFTYYKHTSLSYTGTTYIKHLYGPFSDLIAQAVSELKQDNLIQTEPYYYKESSRLELTTNQSVALEDDHVLNKIIDSMVKILNDTNAEELSELSNKENAWLKTSDYMPISYEYADELNLDFFKTEL